jgi:hypothetical protein
MQLQWLECELMGHLMRLECGSEGVGVCSGIMRRRTERRRGGQQGHLMKEWTEGKLGTQLTWHTGIPGLPSASRRRLGYAFPTPGPLPATSSPLARGEGRREGAMGKSLDRG